MIVRLLLAVFAVLLPAGAHAARFDVPVQGSRELTVAIAAPSTPVGDPDKVATLIRDTVERDLDLTGYFSMIPIAAHIERGVGAEPGSFSWGSWTSLGAAALVKFQIIPAGDGRCDPTRMCLDVYVYDVLGQEKLAGKRLRAPASNAIALGHEAASVVLMALVGEPGFFGATLAAIRQTGGNKEVWLVDVTGDHARAVTKNGAINLSPAWSADRTQIAWTSYRRGNPDLYVKDLGSGSVRTLSDRPGLNISASFSPDGTLVALARSTNGDTDLYLLDARTGREVRRLTEGGGIDVSPHFSPDGTQIVFASERSGGSQIYVVPTSGGSARRVTNVSGFFTDPVFSPDGSRIAFVSRKGSFDVLTVRPDGSGMVRVTQDTGDNEDPTWSPDGRYLVFSSTRSGRSELWLSTADGRHQVQLTSSGGWSQPVWTR